MENFCVSCLSRNRTLSLLDDPEIIILFKYLVQDHPHSLSEPEIKLCWECVRHLSNICKFQKNLCTSMRFVSDYSKLTDADQVGVPTFSALSRTRIMTTIIQGSASCEGMRNETPVANYQDVDDIEDEDPVIYENDEEKNKKRVLTYRAPKSGYHSSASAARYNPIGNYTSPSPQGRKGVTDWRQIRKIHYNAFKSLSKYIERAIIKEEHIYFLKDLWNHYQALLLEFSDGAGTPEQFLDFTAHHLAQKILKSYSDIVCIKYGLRNIVCKKTVYFDEYTDDLLMPD